MNIHPAYISKINSNYGKQIIFVMIPNKEKEGWHCHSVKSLSALLRGITSKLHGDLYCLNCLHSFATKEKLESHEKLCKKEGFCRIALPTQKNNILEFNQYMKSDQMLYINYDGIESLVKKLANCENNPEKSSTTKQENIFFADIQCQQLGHLIIQKISIVYVTERLYEKFL